MVEAVLDAQLPRRSAASCILMMVKAAMGFTRDQISSEIDQNTISPVPIQQGINGCSAWSVHVYVFYQVMS
ncbi:UNVERIFIED_CONTAM: hypothetical protein NY603_32745, partial [Bacteroidetes bacterium 56_B9]